MWPLLKIHSLKCEVRLYCRLWSEVGNCVRLEVREGEVSPIDFAIPLFCFREKCEVRENVKLRRGEIRRVDCNCLQLFVSVSNFKDTTRKWSRTYDKIIQRKVHCQSHTRSRNDDLNRKTYLHHQNHRCRRHRHHRTHHRHHCPLQRWPLF